MQRTINLYEQLSYFEASEDFASELNALYQQLTSIRASLDQQVDRLVAGLGAQIMNDKLPGKGSFFTGIHRWWKNLFGGHNNKKNPYYWQNRLGALGRTDLDPPTVEEFRIMNNFATALAEAIDANPQPLVMKILNSWSAQLKAVMKSHLDDMMNRVREMAGRVSHGAKAPEPVREPAPVEPDEDEDEEETPPPAPKPVPKKEKERPPIYIGGEKTAFKDLPPKLQQAILDAEARGGSVEDALASFMGGDKKKPVDPVPTDDDKSDGDGEVKKSGIDLTDDDAILADENLNVVRAIVAKHPGASMENIRKGTHDLSPEERHVFTVISRPWFSLSPKDRSNWNKRGGNGNALSTRNRNGFPFRLAPVLRAGDPRINILKRYYPNLYRELDEKGRVEHPGDDPAMIRDRIRAKTKEGISDGEFETHEPVEPKTAADRRVRVRKRRLGPMKPEPSDDRADAAPRKGPVLGPLPPMPGDDGGRESIEDTIRDFPKPVASAIKKLAESDEDKAAEVAKAWSTVSERDDKAMKKRFADFLHKGEFDHAIAMSHDDEDDDDAMSKLENGVTNGPQLAEVLRRRLKLQREGKIEPWQPQKGGEFAQRLRDLSAKLYNES